MMEKGHRLRVAVGTTARFAVKASALVGDVLRSPLNYPRVLIYHRVVPRGLGLQFEVSPRQFLSQLVHVLDNYQLSSLDDAVGEARETDAEGRVVFTFDDGYADVYHWAFPHLLSRDVPFVLYLATEPIESQTPLFGRETAPPMTWDQVGAMMSSGLVEIGAHTHTHADLRHVTSDQIEWEVGASNELIRKRLGMTPIHFAYPWGYWSEQADPVIRREYRTGALGSVPPSDVEDGDSHLVHRIPVQRSDRRPFFKRKLRTGLILEDKVRKQVRQYKGP